MKTKKYLALRFWSQYVLQIVGLSALGAVVFLFLILLGKSNGFQPEVLKILVPVVYPVYFMTVGVFFLSIMTMSCFQAYVHVLLAMNCTRKRCIAGVLTATAVTVLLIQVICMVFWQFGLPKEEQIPGWQLALLLVTGGGWLVVASFSLTMGAAIIRWGKIGVLIASIMYGLLGAGVGLSLVAPVFRTKELTHIGYGELLQLPVHWGAAILAAGLALYLAAGIFVSVVVRRMEVKM